MAAVLISVTFEITKSAPEAAFSEMTAVVASNLSRDVQDIPALDWSKNDCLCTYENEEHIVVGLKRKLYNHSQAVCHNRPNITRNGRLLFGLTCEGHLYLRASCDLDRHLTVLSLFIS